MKIEYAKKLGIPVSTSEELIQALSKSESNAENNFGGGVLIRQEKQNIPYPISIAYEKGKSIIEANNRTKDSYFVVSDVVWRLSSDLYNYFFNKPKGEKRRENELVQIYKDSRGKKIHSDSGIALVHPKDSTITLFYTSLLLGQIREDMNPNLLLELIRDNPGFSSGLSLELMLEHILKARKELELFVKIFHVSETNSIVPEETKSSHIRITRNQENYLLYKAIAIGIIPPQIVFSS